MAVPSAVPALSRRPRIPDPHSYTSDAGAGGTSRRPGKRESAGPGHPKDLGRAERGPERNREDKKGRAEQSEPRRREAAKAQPSKAKRASK